MKNILKSMAGILVLLLIYQSAEAFCGIGGIFGTPPAPTCTCSQNKVAIKRMSENVCLEERCISQGASQHYLNNGWINGCCAVLRLGNHPETETFQSGTFPNPASSSITTSLTLDRSQHVTIELFDVNSRMVTIVADKYFEAGNNDVDWNASDLNDGIYFLQVRSDELLKTEKLVIAK